MNYQLIKNDIPFELSALETVFVNRGMFPQDIDHYLHTTDADIYPPEMIANIKEGAVMLLSHIKNQDNIFIQVDADCDGYTSAAALINYLFYLFPGYAQTHIQYRLHTEKIHGLKEELLNDILAHNIKLIIMPDASSNDYEAHKLYKDHGIDVLVIDHHNADYVSPDACIINNQLCDYPNKTLSGVGMVYKFCSYLDTLTDKKGADLFLDLTAIGLIGDMMDLRSYETRRLIDKGLNSIRNIFLQTMIDRNSFSIERGGGLNPHTVGFFIVPFINAITRVGSLEDKTLVFEAMLDYQAMQQIPSTKRGHKIGQYETKVEQACRVCNNIKNKQNKVVDDCIEIVEKIIEEKNLLENKILILKLEPTFAIDKGITGLVANKLAAKYQRPTLILNKVVHDDGTISWAGSARGYDKSAFKDFQGFMNDSGYAEYAQGHSNAFGSSILETDFKTFVEYANEKLKDYDFSPQLNVDLIWQANDLNPNDILTLGGLDTIWGQGLEKPLVAIENVKVHSGDIQLLKETTLKITLPNNVTLIKFGSSQEEFDDLYSELGCITINVVGECKVNEWNGNISPQIEIKDYEIVKTTQYYF